MTEHEAEKHTSRRLAHERLSTGALARWARVCATHPWRVVVGWIGIVVVLVVLVATVGGSLRDEFEIPGSDTQKATDLIESQFASEQGGVLNVVFAAPRASAWTRRRKAAIAEAVAQLKTREFKATEDKAGIESVGDPFNKDTFSDNGRIAYAEAQFDRTIYDKDRDAVVAVEDAVRKAVDAGRHRPTEFNGDAEFPPIEQGTQELLGLLDGADRAADRLPDVRRGFDPDRAGARRRSARRSCSCSSSPG